MPHMPSENIVNMVKTIHKRYHFQAGQMTRQALVFQPERQSWAEGEMDLFRLWKEQVPQRSCCSSERMGFPNGVVAAPRKGRIPKSYGTTNPTQETYWERHKRMATSAQKRSSKELSRRQASCRLSWWWGAIQSGLGLVGFCGLILGQVQGLVGFVSFFHPKRA